jgi:hypothetical protein
MNLFNGENLSELSQFSKLPIFFLYSHQFLFQSQYSFLKAYFILIYDIVSNKLRHVTFLLLLLLQMLHCKDTVPKL